MTEKATALVDTADRPSSNFLRAIIEKDNQNAKYSGQVVTRFPPEPNGYLHYGHAKSIILNFGLAQDYHGRCHLRFDDTNPLKENPEFEASIADSVRWLGYDWGQHRHHASDYFDELYRFAEWFITAGLAYVDGQTAEEVRATRGTLKEPGKESPDRNRSAEENLDLFRRMKAGEFPDGRYVLRLKIDMASPNLNLRDPAIYRIRHAAHHRTGDKWNVYPLYDYTHCISDAIERVTHSICTLEFQDHRPLYDWVIERLAEGGQLPRPLPCQYEFARLNLTYVVLSKRFLIELVSGGYVDGWDDPRMPTLVGARRRGFTPAGFKLFMERAGVSKSDSWLDFSLLENAMRDDLNEAAHRRVAVINPVKLIIDNYPENQSEECFAPNHPKKPELGARALRFTRELWIEKEDFMETPTKGFFRMTLGNEVRLRYGFLARCVSVDKDENGEIIAIHATYDPATKSGTEGATARKVKGNIHWLSVNEAVPAEIRLYDRLFAVPFPGAKNPTGGVDEANTLAVGAKADEAGGANIDAALQEDTDQAVAPSARHYLDDLNTNSKHIVKGFVEPAAASALPEERFQFERLGYFVADREDHREDRPVFNRAVTLNEGAKK